MKILVNFKEEKKEVYSSVLYTIWELVLDLINAGDRLPLGAPALMISPRGVNVGMVDLVKKRDDKYKISSEELKISRIDIAIPEMTNSSADYWMQTGKGFAIDVEKTDMELRAPFPW